MKEEFVFKCNFCSKTFTKKSLKSFDVNCPKCKEYDVECLGVREKK